MGDNDLNVNGAGTSKKFVNVKVTNLQDGTTEIIQFPKGTKIEGNTKDYTLNADGEIALTKAQIAGLKAACSSDNSNGRFILDEKDLMNTKYTDDKENSRGNFESDFTKTINKNLDASYSTYELKQLPTGGDSVSYHAFMDAEDGVVDIRFNNQNDGDQSMIRITLPKNGEATGDTNEETDIPIDEQFPKSPDYKNSDFVKITITDTTNPEFSKTFEVPKGTVIQGNGFEMTVTEDCDKALATYQIAAFDALLNSYEYGQDFQDNRLDRSDYNGGIYSQEVTDKLKDYGSSFELKIDPDSEYNERIARANEGGNSFAEFVGPNGEKGTLSVSLPTDVPTEAKEEDPKWYEFWK
ncbi:MAG: hypothetical protein R3Y28_01795 [Candidatus Gastranaerophilales bacterium]